jgi:hypothetical protein
MQLNKIPIDAVANIVSYLDISTDRRLLKLFKLITVKYTYILDYWKTCNKYDEYYCESNDGYFHTCNGNFHRDNGPAIEYADGKRMWYQYGRLHRLDGPAIEYTNGKRMWYQYGRLHRLNGPALEINQPISCNIYFINGYLDLRKESVQPFLLLFIGGIFLFYLSEIKLNTLLFILLCSRYVMY